MTTQARRPGASARAPPAAPPRGTSPALGLRVVLARPGPLPAGQAVLRVPQPGGGAPARSARRARRPGARGGTAAPRHHRLRPSRLHTHRPLRGGGGPALPRRRALGRPPDTRSATAGGRPRGGRASSKRAPRSKSCCYDDGRDRRRRGAGRSGRPRASAPGSPIGADGLRSVVARRLGRRRHGTPARLAFVAHVSRRAGPRGLAEMHVGTQGTWGSTGSRSGVANVALVRPPGARARGPGRCRPVLLRDAGASFRASGDGCGRARLVRRVLVTGPFAAWSGRVVADGALLVGDAADFFDPFTGEGIYARAQRRRTRRGITRPTALADRGRGHGAPASRAIGPRGGQRSSASGRSSGWSGTGCSFPGSSTGPWHASSGAAWATPSSASPATSCPPAPYSTPGSSPGWSCEPTRHRGRSLPPAAQPLRHRGHRPDDPGRRGAAGGHDGVQPGLGVPRTTPGFGLRRCLGRDAPGPLGQWRVRRQHPRGRAGGALPSLRGPACRGAIRGRAPGGRLRRD